MRVACLLVGPDEYSMALAGALSGVVQTLLIAPAPLVERYREDLPPALEVAAFPWPRHRDPRNLVLLARIRARLAAFQPDLVHFLADTTVWLALGLPLLRRWPIVVTIHDVAYHPGDVQSRRVPMAPIRLLRRKATALVVHGEGLKALLVQEGLAPPAGIHCIHHLALTRHPAIAARLGLRRQAGDGRKRILFFGRAMPYKGLPVLLEAMDAVVATHPEALLVIAGTGPDITRLRPELEARPFVELRDRYVPDEEAAQLFLDADLVALPYVEASQSGVAALAAGFGRPVVATRTGELGELVAATGMGPVVAPGDALALAHAIEALLDEPSRARAHAMASRAAAQGPLAPATIARAHLAVYACALAGRPPER